MLSERRDSTSEHDKTDPLPATLKSPMPSQLGIIRMATRAGFPGTEFSTVVVRRT
jgi:hypothetical protein